MGHDYVGGAHSFENREARDVDVGLSHFTSSFLLIIVAVLMTICFGLIAPMLGLLKADIILTQSRTIVGGLISSLMFLIGYFIA
jgi:hypothetical protein